MRAERKSMRLSGWDYSENGCYFLTLCSLDRKCIFSRVVGCGILDAPVLQLTDKGSVVKNVLSFIENHFADVRIRKYVIMPNHVHLLVSVLCGASGMPHPTNARIPKLVSSLKRFSNKQSGSSLWQTGYYDRIVRDEEEYLRIWQYIDNNPAAWLDDEYYVF